VAPWSLRPRNIPTVAVPFAWSDLNSIAPDGFELGNLPEEDRLAVAADNPVDLRPALETLRLTAAETGIEIVPFDRFRS